ncbi:hypothetical protein Csa_023393 [Cucumis sativus]|nr:hypothetical protein Csa_023393 [Cucumis sativus]
MDAAEHHNPQPSFFHQILPPRLEDAGLEDSALPPDSIREAFFKAASAVKSRATARLSHSDDEDDDVPCSPTSALPTDEDAPAICATKKGLELPEFGKDEVVIGGMEERRGKGCVVDGLEGLEIGDDAEKESGKEEKKKPVLGED